MPPYVDAARCITCVSLRLKSEGSARGLDPDFSPSVLFEEVGSGPCLSHVWRRWTETAKATDCLVYYEALSQHDEDSELSRCHCW